MEPSGAIRWNGAYYVNGQGGKHWAAGDLMTNRQLVSHVSYDFENSTRASAMGFRRDVIPPRVAAVQGREEGEQIHMGAGLWNRGNVIVGFYGQWHGHPNNDRRWVSIDLGLVVSHDALHFAEPIPDARIVDAREMTYELPYERAPALMQGQGFANVGDRTLFWYSA